ncbi:plasmid mobilization relaxosome protein MobC [Pseudomonas sp. KU26590]|uniref:plasmid mobilization relaxosome protein MobC n=1 Tax=Pseudomonas sp. KU26590 TaxID=2991051 RepID=UPI00223DED25|nr:plasmid mobilization relaxosome protein MobC [Pseudomonas sp. KU26590]UZJ60899.1 plasmid mobilization relaxosome protein MobC [Pseudomonas sp. KU26590]
MGRTLQGTGQEARRSNQGSNRATAKKTQSLPPSRTYQQTKPIPYEEPKVRFEILLTPSEKAALTERDEAERCSQRRWIIDAIRAGLTNEAQFGMSDIEALGESNYQLLAIGQNLNQIARKLNEGVHDPVQTELIKGLSAIIDRHTHIVNVAIRASLERWVLE